MDGLTSVSFRKILAHPTASLHSGGSASSGLGRPERSASLGLGLRGEALRFRPVEGSASLWENRKREKRFGVVFPLRPKRSASDFYGVQSASWVGAWVLFPPDSGRRLPRQAATPTQWWRAARRLPRQVPGFYCLSLIPTQWWRAACRKCHRLPAKCPAPH